MKTFTLKKWMSVTLLAMLLMSWNVSAQTVIFLETCGEAGKTSGTRDTPAGYADWDNGAPVTFDGNTDIRATTTMDTHVWFAAAAQTDPLPERNLIISGINTSGKTNLKLSFDVASNKSNGNANALFIKVKDLTNNNESSITIPSTEIAKQNDYITISNLSGIPATSNLQITFYTTAASNPYTFGYRLDNIKITSGDAPVLSSNNNLASLTVNHGTLVPEFDPAITTYTVDLSNVVIPANEIGYIIVTYTLADSKASAVKTDATDIPGTTSIAVTAENGATKTYKINFTLTSGGSWIETFEGESAKASYAVADYQGVAALWEVQGVISNTDDKDKKNGAYSARLRDPNTSHPDDTSYLVMKENKANGAGVISLYHGMYSNHTGGSYTLEVSKDGGATWNAFSAEVEEVPTEWTKVSFTANVEGNIRIKITKTSATNNSSINIDDIQITDFPKTGIPHIANELSVYTADGTLFVKNLNGKANIAIYDIAGRLVKQTTATEIPLSNKGIYIVKVNAQAFKVINK